MFKEQMAVCRDVLHHLFPSRLLRDPLDEYGLWRVNLIHKKLINAIGINTFVLSKYL